MPEEALTGGSSTTESPRRATGKPRGEALTDFETTKARPPRGPAAPGRTPPQNKAIELPWPFLN
jgi:hypothetical protein